MTKQEKITITHKTIAAALAAAQSEMGAALKSANNPHFKSKYADLSSVVSACMPALNAHGIAVLQPTFDDDSGRYVKTILIHGDTGETLECRVPLIVGKNDMQGYGSAVTYARRYGLMGMAGIAPEDDDGNAAAANPPKPQQRQQKPQEPDAEAIQKAQEYLAGADSLDDLKDRWGRIPKPVATIAEVIAAKDAAKERLSAQNAADLGGDELPY